IISISLNIKYSLLPYTTLIQSPQASWPTRSGTPAKTVLTHRWIGIILSPLDIAYPARDTFRPRPMVRRFANFAQAFAEQATVRQDRKSTRLHSSYTLISYEVFC